jgi:GNAT superfamily N-acetyltransferase
MKTENIKIEYLCDYIHFADTAAKWIFDEFINGIKHDRSYGDVLAAIKNCHKTELPIRLIALIDDKCVGTVSIVVNDLQLQCKGKCRDYTPWLASLYVDKEYRNQKIGEQLIDSVKNIVKQLDYDKLYLRTEHASGYYRRLGWEFIETCEDNYNLKPDVFMWNLA